jgi:hypothetical protein
MLQDCYLMMQVPNENSISFFMMVFQTFSKVSPYIMSRFLSYIIVSILGTLQIKEEILVLCVKHHCLSWLLWSTASVPVLPSSPYRTIHLIQSFIISELISVIYVPLSLSTVSGSSMPRKSGVKETWLKENMIKGDIVLRFEYYDPTVFEECYTDSPVCP